MPMSGEDDRAVLGFHRSQQTRCSYGVRTHENSSMCHQTERSRLSGGKRDLDTARTTDDQQPVLSEQPKKKQKITYILPRQNMEEGHFYVVLGEDVDVSSARFKILSLLGEGTFGKVVEIWDRKYKIYGACKVVRNIPKYTRDAEVEIRFMERIRRHDPDDKFQLMKIQRYFTNDSGHKCIVMPKYGPSLLDHLNKYGPLPHRQLAEIIFQAAIALDFFHTEMKLIHTDLKLENLLLEKSEVATIPETGQKCPALPCKIRICDFGGTCDERHSRDSIVSTRHYRSPEVILYLGWMYSTDAWSMGCIIYELFTNKLLFSTHDNLEHLHMMERTLGKLPPHFFTATNDEGRQMFTSQGTLRAITDPKSQQRCARCRPIKDTVPDPDLCDLILGLLNYSRSRRINMREMSQHPYVVKHYPESLLHPQHPSNRSAACPLPPTPPS